MYVTKLKPGECLVLNGEVLIIVDGGRRSVRVAVIDDDRTFTISKASIPPRKNRR